MPVFFCLSRTFRFAPSVVATAPTSRPQLHHASLSGVMPPYGSPHGLSVVQIAPLVQQQLSFMSYLNVFRSVGVLALVTWPMFLFLQLPPQRADLGV